MARVYTKIGDVFSVQIDEQHKKFFQLIAFDLLQLNSDVIRAFEETYPIDSKPKLSDIVNGKVSFYAHCVTKWGVKMNLWEKVENIKDVGDIRNILFRTSADAGKKVGEEGVKVSNRWYVWRIGDKDFTYVGELEGENRNAELGIVVNPYDIVDRIKTGKYNFFYPGYE